MNTRPLIAFAASLALNLTVFAGLDWSAREAQAAPKGIVSITQLVDASELETYAQLSHPKARTLL